MKTPFLLLSALAVAMACLGKLHAQTVDDLVTTTGLSTTGTDGNPWVYVTWDTSTLGPLTGHTLAVYMKPGSPTDAGTFTRQAIVNPATDPQLIKSLIARGTCLGEPIERLDTLVTDILRAFQRPLAGTQAPEFPALPATLEERLGAVLTRPEVNIREQIFPILHMLSPTASMCLGQAWSGELPVAPGAEATIEVRDFDPTTQIDLAVIGRVTVVAAQHNPLPAASAPVQVPDDGVTGDLNIRLRWAMPATLLRRQMQLQGFEIWRVEKDFAEASNWHTTAPSADTLRSNLGATVRSLLNVPRRESETYTDANVADFTTDPETYFYGDDNDRYRSGGAAFNDGEQFYYFTVAIDLLGRPGGVSPGGLMLASRTLPPPAPQRLDIVYRTNDKLTGTEAGQPVFELSWKPNTDTVLDQTDSYQIWRSRNASAFAQTPAFPPPIPIPYPNLVMLEAVPQPLGNRMTFIDDTLTPTHGDTFWYSVRAVHQGARGDVFSAFAAPVPGLVPNLTPAIAPSPAQTMAAGFCSRVVLNSTGNSVIPSQGRPPRTAVLEVTRASPDIAWVEVSTFAPSIGPPQKLHFAEGQTVASFDFTIPSVGVEPPAAYNILVTATSKGGALGSQFPQQAVVFLSGTLPDNQSVKFEFLADVIDASKMSWDYPPARNLLGPAIRIQGVTPAAGDAGQLTGTVPGLADGDDVFVTQVVGEFGVLDLGIARVFQGRVAFPGDVGEVYDVRKINGGDPDACAQNFHNIRVEGTTKINPVRLSFIAAAGVREYRLYRQVDTGELTMVKQGELPGTAGTVVTTIDVGLPPNSACLSYFVQTFDADGNSSPLQRLGDCVQTVTPLPRPVIGQPEFLGTPGNPRVRLRWTSATEGVENFEIYLHPVDGGEVTLAQAGLGILTYTRARSSSLLTRAFDPVLQEQVAVPGLSIMQLKSAAHGSIETIKVPHSSIYISPFIGSGPTSLGTGPLFSQEFDIAPGVEYCASIVALGPSTRGGQARSEASSLIKFRHTPPPPPPSEDCIMPWPYRDLPPVVTFNPDVVVRRFVPKLGLNLDLQGEQPVWPYDHDAYPVGVRIGRIALINTGFNGHGGVLFGFSTQSDPSDDFLELRPSGFQNSTATDPNDHVFRGLAGGANESDSLLPVVLYRTQVPSATYPDVSDVVVQCSPKINLIAFENTGSTLRLRDPYIGVSGIGLDPLEFAQNNPKLRPVPPPGEINPDPNFAQLNLYLLDTKPVIDSAKYHYWVVRFHPNGEPAAVIDAGEVEIPES